MLFMTCCASSTNRNKIEKIIEPAMAAAAFVHRRYSKSKRCCWSGLRPIIFPPTRARLQSRFCGAARRANAITFSPPPRDLEYHSHQDANSSMTCLPVVGDPFGTRFATPSFSQSTKLKDTVFPTTQQGNVVVKRPGANGTGTKRTEMMIWPRGNAPLIGWKCCNKKKIIGLVDHLWHLGYHSSWD